MRGLLTCTSVLLLSACGSLGDLFEPNEQTLADISAVELPAHEDSLPQVSREALAQIYQDVLEQQQDPQTRLQVKHRLADIRMLGAEEKQARSASEDAPFALAIAAYEDLLRENPEYTDKDLVLYQLSKAYDLNGQSERSQATLERLSSATPQSEHLPEVNFRRAERYFVQADYTRAEATYEKVIKDGPGTPFYTRALYMQGWSRFKQDRYAASIEAFTTSLDRLLLSADSIEALPRGDRELVQDSLRVMALMFSYLDGTQTIASTYEDLGIRPYQYLFYQALGELYLSQDRYRDSAETYQAYTVNHPGSPLVHLFKMREISAYEAGGFGDLILSAKEDYVAVFSVEGDYWSSSDEKSRAQIEEKLLSFIEELASYYHARAQAAMESKLDQPAINALYAQAAHYYRLYLDSFPADPDAPQMAFLLAESLFEAGDYAAAIPSYEEVAYIYVDDSRAADAAYTAILAYEKLQLQVDEKDLDGVRRNRIDAQLRFYEHFGDDSRAAPVIAHAASQLYELEDYQAALTASQALLERSPTADPNLLIPTWLVTGHSLVATENFSAAEQAYQQSLSLMASDDSRRINTTEQLAAAIYRQGELENARQAYPEAAQHFSRVSLLAPSSSVRPTAQYDASVAFIQAGDLAQANELLLDFRQRFAEHELSTGIAVMLVKNYEKLELWREAAEELDGIAAANGSNEASRQAVIVAAQYYEKVGDTDNAIARYRQHANSWQQPLNEYLEVMQRLSVLYISTGEDEKQRYWLEKIVQVHDNAAGEQSDRSRFLAASAASVLANHEYSRFVSIRLSDPLKSTLDTKKQAMQRALTAYRKCNDYAVQEFATLSTYRIAKIYQQLSGDLMNSERPAELDALALEQYEIMLEELAYPFEEKAIAVYASNAQRSSRGVYDKWVRESFVELARLLPARYGKVESTELQQPVDSGRSWGKRELKNLDDLNLTAIKQREEGNFSAAQETYLSALSVDQDYPPTHRNIGILYDLYLGAPNKALQHYSLYQSLIGAPDRTVSGWIADLERRQLSLAPEAM